MARRIEFGQVLATAGDAEQERLGAACSIGFPIGRMTGDTELVAVWVSKVRAIVVGVVFGPQAGLTVRSAAICQRYLMDVTNGSAIGCQKGDHVAVARVRWLFVIRLADEEQRPWAARGLPASPGAAAITEPQLDLQSRHQRLIEAECPIKVTHADENVREHGTTIVWWEGKTMVIVTVGMDNGVGGLSTVHRQVV